MRKITLRFVIALLTFAIGLTITTLWLIRRAPKVENPAKPVCQWSASSERVSSNRFANDFYFPVGAFSPDEVREKGFVKFYSNALAAMDEPALASLKQGNIEVYRFLWLRSFHPAVVVRIWKSGDERCLSVKQFDGLGEYADDGYVFPKTFSANVTHPITEVEWKHFIELLGRANFWAMPTVDGEPLGMDGASWVFEAVRDGQYHLVDRQSPMSGEYREACVYLLEISGLKVDKSRNELY